ncbi:MAG: acetyl-CoA hydrolase/transferase family protein [Candidatus Sumerlaeia bacterium]|nr:acetyl-CoA hydrolase/transferase family protein [Candidatus Sumerlaeia bacterium]
MVYAHRYPIISAEEGAAHIKHDMLVAFSGFTPSGAAKAIPRALATRAKAEHAAERAFKLRVLTGASTGKDLDEALAQAEAISWRAPYQSSPTLRKQLNAGQVKFVDMHLSHLPQVVAEGFFGKIDIAVIEATDITPDGRVFLSSSIGASPTFLREADKVIIEINRAHAPRVSEMSDIFLLPAPPNRSPIPLYGALDRIGFNFATVDPAKVIGVVETNEPDDVGGFDEPDPVSTAIGQNVIKFLFDEMTSGRIPREFLPMQSGVGNIANAVMSALGESPDIPPFIMYSEVFQDSLIALMERGKLIGASTTSLTLSPPMMKRVYENMDFYAPRIVLRPQEISNNPGVIRRLGVITTNTALEVDIYGHINSTHVCGSQMMNGIGGSGDFTRNAYISIYMCPSTAKGGRISTLVPMCSHVDHNEHSVQVVITEQGIADLRGLDPTERAHTLINKCAHPGYRDYLNKYIGEAERGHIPHILERAFELHLNLKRTGSMLPEVFPAK